MSLQGTLDTFTLVEILDLVERSRKTGALELRDPQSRGVLYVSGGRFSAAEASDLVGPVESDEGLEARLVDVCFELFQVQTGLFEFEDDRYPAWPVRGGCDVAPIVEQVQQVRREWVAIEAVIPSLDCRPDVVDDLDGESVVLDKAGFRVLRAVDGERNVRAIARSVGSSVVEVGKILKELVEAGALVVPAVADRAMVEELVLPADGDIRSAPATRAPVGRNAVDAAFPEAADELTALPEVPGLVVPSSPEGLVQPARTSRPADLVAAADAASVEPRPDPEPVAPVEAVQPVTPAEAPVEPNQPVDFPDDDEPAPDRGALLRLFSSLRDT